tara:strand:+ start:522 stop:731 length:210 start_codon:yes stop_codon:yes gene_type:complete
MSVFLQKNQKTTENVIDIIQSKSENQKKNIVQTDAIENNLEDGGDLQTSVPSIDKRESLLTIANVTKIG